MKRPCPHCEKNGIWVTLEPVVTPRGNVERCWQCGGEYVGDDCVHPLVAFITVELDYGGI